jgi:ADP-ribosyl-[dinitrogen reductase] hydrolase
MRERALGAYLGLALGDALGATVEFMPRAEIAARHGTHQEILGGGWLRLPCGAVTDDTEMSLALGDAILSEAGFVTRAVANSFASWLRSGPRDCGATCRRGIQRYLLDGSLSAPPNDRAGGNGAVMRNLPVVLATLGDAEARQAHTLSQCHITHHQARSDAAALALGKMVAQLVCGEPIQNVERTASLLAEADPIFEYRGYTGPAGAYIVETVRTVLDCFFATRDFESCVVRTVNRGDDADTTGALAGMLAGACYGADALPSRWLELLDTNVRRRIERQANGLLALSPAFSPRGAHSI